MNNTSKDFMESNRQQLIFKFLAGKTSPDEESELKKWMDEDPENSELFGFCRDLWLATSERTSRGFYHASQAWKKIEKTLRKLGTREPAERVFISGTGFRYFLKIAAFIVFTFLSGFICSRLFTGKNKLSVVERYAVVNAPLGSKTQIVLPDSTEVWLNAGSSLTYPTQSEKKERNVSLTGEAYFKVKADKSRPFVVTTNHIDIRALGTIFNVKAYPEDTMISALLIEGQLKIDANINDNILSYNLKPDQHIAIPVKRTVDAESVKIEDIDENISRSIISWKEEQWTIQGVPLKTLAVMLERRYNIKIHIISDALNDYKFSGIIKNDTFEQVLQILRLTTPLKYLIGKGEVWWDIDPELAKNYEKILKKQ